MLVSITLRATIYVLVLKQVIQYGLYPRIKVQRAMKRPIVTLNLPEYKIQQLHKKGYIFCEDVNIETIRLVAGITAEEWKKLTANTKSTNALDLCQVESDNNHIVSFSNALDKILGQGVPLKSITEFSGLPGTGKTQIW